MTYQVGISSGWFNIGRDPNLLGLATKAAGFGATAGVTFNQIDLESISEFLEPKVRENMKRVQKELGLKIGFHAEIGHMAALESSERRIWEQAHARLVDSVKNAVELGAEYINFHLSSTMLLQFEEARIRPFGFQYQVVTPEGEPFWKLAEKSPIVKNHVMSLIRGKSHIPGMVATEQVYQRMTNEVYERIMLKEFPEDEKKLREVSKRDPEITRHTPEMQRRLVEERVEMLRQMYARKFKEEVESPEFFYKAWTRSPFAQYILEAGEIDAYMAVAKHMKETGDPLWSQIAKNEDPEKAYIESEHAFNAAVAARYIEGHLRVRHPILNKQLDGMSVLEWVNKKGPVLCFELPEVERGQGHVEGMYRLFDPRHAHWFIRKIGSPRIKLTIDFEHMLAQRLDPYKIIPELPADFGKLVHLFHLGEPKPYWGTAHIPIPLGSQAQEVIYEWLYMLRQKGFKDGILIFERGSGRGGGKTPYEVFEQSVLALRQIATHLDKGIEPRQLPLEFYGMSEKNEPEFKRELVTMREHAWDPLEGTLSVPEEKHTFLSAAAVAKQKGPEWEKRKLR